MKTVIEMARDQGLPETEVAGVFIVNQDDLGRFAALVRADEREACAKVCDGVQDCGPENGCCPTYWNESLERAATAIRARGNT